MDSKSKYIAKVAPGGAGGGDTNDHHDPGGHTKAPNDALWTKSTGANTSDRSTASSSRIVSFKDVAQTLNERSRLRRYGFWVKFWSCIAGVVWNSASPIKSYVLSFYGLPGDDLVFSHNMNWTMEVDYKYARELYDMSGIKYTAPEDQPIRFMNMYLDFVVFNRAKIWAKHLDDFQQDPYVGQFCRASLVPKGTQITDEMNWYCLTNGYFADNNYLEQESCRVSEVSEAVMCLKGINVLQLLNYEWQSSFDPTNEYVQEAAQIYQDAIFPNLTACLERRAFLVARLGRDDALQQVTEELGKNFSLDPTGYGGKKGLYAEYRYFEGFTDLSGKQSGVRYSKMSGSLPERTQPTESDTNALVAGRERLWWLTGVDPMSFRDSVRGFSFFAPYLFMGFHINSKATAGRFIEGYSIRKVGTVGICKNWELIPTSNKEYPDPIYLTTQPTSSVLTAYGGGFFVPRAIADNSVTDPEQKSLLSSRLSSQCISRDGCIAECLKTLTGAWLTTFARSGLCQSRDIAQNIINRQGYVNWKCIGEGTGKESFSFLFTQPIIRSDGSNFTSYQIQNVATAGAIVACVLGGRIPQAGEEPYPNVFFDLIKNGPNTIITTTFSRGTEKVLVNVYALVSFVGCAVFATWVIQNMQRVLRMVVRVKRKGLTDRKGLTQILDSVFTLNISTISHGRNIQLSKVILWLNLVTWYLGAADSNCTWWVDGVDLWSEGFKLQSSDSPYYMCKPGYFVEFLDSTLGVVRLISISYNFYSLTCQHLILRGATRYVLPFLSPILFFGLLPTFVASAIITSINHVRLEMGALTSLHNQLFLVMMWVLYLFAYHWILQNETVGRILVNTLCKFKLSGKQKIKPGSVAEAIIGPYYLTMPGFARAEATEWIPLSVALESPTFDINQLDFTTRQYSLTKRVPGLVVKPPVIPDWVLEDDEFFFC